MEDMLFRRILGTLEIYSNIYRNIKEGNDFTLETKQQLIEMIREMINYLYSEAQGQI